MITKTLFGKTKNGENVYAFHMINNNNVSVTVLTLGGIIQSIRVPDKNKHFDDITTGFDNVHDYEINPAYFGAIIGRVANRIFKGKYKIDGVTYQAPLNQEQACLHGGLSGFDKKIWNANVVTNEDYSEQLDLKYLSADGEESFPGNLEVKAVYKLDANEDQLTLTIMATTTAPTLVNLTNHAYFNLGGHQHLNIYHHKLKVNADYYLPKNEFAVPTGKISPVSGTPLDFTAPKELGDPIKRIAEKGVHGIDHNFCLRSCGRIVSRGGGGGNDTDVGRDDSSFIFDGSSGDWNKVAHHAVHLVHEQSGRSLDVYTNQPGIQVYTGNYLNGLKGKEGAIYKQHSCIALEPQLWPDAVHHPHFPSMLLNVGKAYENIIIYKFSTK